jgi:Na+/H+-translocating membrane pyrophosphatase
MKQGVLILFCVAVMVGLTVVFAFQSWEQAAWIAGVVSALVGVLALAVTVWAMARRSSASHPSAWRTGDAMAEGFGSRTVSGVVGGSGEAHDTGAARAVGGGTAVSGVDSGD